MSSPEPIDAETAGRKLRYLKGTELFRDFTRAQLEPFHHTIRMETCRAGHVFYRPGETGEVMFLLKEGGAQLYRLAADGRKFVFADVPPSSIFGEMACIGQAMYECFAEATADSVICTLTRADVQRLVAGYRGGPVLHDVTLAVADQERRRSAARADPRWAHSN